MPAFGNGRRSSTKIDEPPTPQTAQILEELQVIKDSCSEEFKRLEKLMNEKKSKADTFEGCIVNELHELQRKYEELTMENGKHVSEIAELQGTVNEKTERVKKIERKLAQAKNERDEVRQSIEKDFVSKVDYTEICEELQEQKKMNNNLQVLEEAARNKMEKIMADKKAVEKAKMDLIRSKRADQDYFLKKLKGLESELHSCREALGKNHSNQSSHRTTTNHRSENHLAANECPSLQDRMRNEHSKNNYIPEKRARRY